MNRRSAYIFAGLTLALLYVYAALHVNYQATRFKNVIHADAAGYYTWLPAVFTYQDSKFAFCDTVFSESPYYGKGSFTGIIIPVANGHTMNKYAIGTALCQLPFFAMAQAYGSLTGEMRGYEIHYQIAWLFGAIFYVCMGMLFLLRIAYRAGQSAWVAFAAVAALVFGTNLFHYTTFDAGYSHAFTFAWMSATWFFGNGFIGKKSPRYLYGLALCMAMMVLIRPFNILLVSGMVLFLATPREWWRIVRENTRKISWALVLAMAVISIHFLGNYWQSGNFFIYGYGKETFDFSQRNWGKFLFGFQIGAFVYSPLLLPLFIAAIWIWLRFGEKYRAAVFLVSFLVISWILSCWGYWTFGCTLGNRPLTDFYAWIVFPVLAYPLVWNTLGAALCGIFLAIGVYFSQVFHYQYRNNIMDWCEMNQQKFFDIFLKTHPRYAYFTADDWSFSQARNSVVLRTFLHPGPFKIVKGLPEKIFQLDSLHLDSTKQYRMLFQCEVNFHQSVHEDALVVYITQNGEYHDILRKMFRKMVREPNRWSPFQFEFTIRPGPPYVDIAFSATDVAEDIMELRHIKVSFIAYDQ